MALSLPRVIAYPINFKGKGAYQIALEESLYGIVFEDDGSTGYLYVIDQKTGIVDALGIYNYRDDNQLREGEDVYLVWSPDLQKAGLYYRGHFYAGVDFRSKQARCRSGFPTLQDTDWKRSDHSWNESIIKGLEP